jgi:3'-phosphoadenosine 5'-phosphosulfate sulfotransferase (PAPS reductase)/FAD synthetase
MKERKFVYQADKEWIDLKLKCLESRFRIKIDKHEYYLSYSGGRDSHFLYWFIKEYLKDTVIPVVAVNTRMEHADIKARIMENADVVLYPKLTPTQIKAEYGIPCFTKWQDEQIRRYQNGSRAKSTMQSITGEGRKTFKLNNTAKELLLSGELHRCSADCCKWTKKKPLADYEKETGLKPIIGVRGQESKQRKNKYTRCLNKKGQFTPLYDWTDEELRAAETIYNIPVPAAYDELDRTGCFGCPYGWHGKNTIKELKMLSPAQRKFTIELFKESYEVLKIPYGDLL